MSATTTVEPLPLPRARDEANNPSRRTEYAAGVTNSNIVTIDGQERTVYTHFDSARLIRLAARAQTAGQGSGDVRKMIVVSMGIILDGLQVSILEDDQLVPHPLLSDPRFEKYKTLPHRVNAQQWMEVRDLPHVVKLSNFLKQNKQFRIQKNPPPPQNSRRKTRDLFQVRPFRTPNRDNPTNYGTEIDAFEVSVNLDYPQGFKSFYQGLTEQMNRWLDVVKEEDKDTRAQMEETLNTNMHFVGGAYFDDKQQEWWPRPVDIGILTIDNQPFPLYPVMGDDLDTDDLMDLIDPESTTEAPVAPEVTDGPNAELTDW